MEKVFSFPGRPSRPSPPVSVKRRLQTADCRPGVKCRESVKCRLQTESKMQAGCKMENEDCTPSSPNS